MIYVGKAIECCIDKNGVAELIFDLKSESVNKFNALTLKELKEAVEKVQAQSNLKALVLTSRKDSFIVGADITEFLSHFKRKDEELLKWIREVNQTFNAIEDLDVPVVAEINGFSLGGGLEVTLTASYRVASKKAKIGLPETQLGIIPGWGGTVRLPRIIGADNAIEWVAMGKQLDVEEALKFGIIDAVVEPNRLREATLNLIKECWEGKRDFRKRRELKISPLQLNFTESMMVFEGSKAFVASLSGPNYPAPLTAVEVMQKGATLRRDEALMIESEAFVRMAKTPTAKHLVQIFLGDQWLKKENKRYQKQSRPFQQVAVLGAGIMGGGISYQCASRGLPVLMKDIRPEAVTLGLTEATQLLKKRVDQGKMNAEEMSQTLNRIHGTLSFGEFDTVDVVVEAVVENFEVKQKVLRETEEKVRPATILCSNTSTISISKLAESLSRPELFCGLHFFNPVHKMPLVEVIRGKKTSEETISTMVTFAEKLGKKPIVVNDCPGFLVNRVLFPYFIGFIQLLNDGADFQHVDKVMEKFGWPMGPAYLLDVVGMDTCYHAIEIMRKGYPDRMDFTGPNVLEVMFQHKRFGQKTGKGFYEYVQDKKGRPQKKMDPEVHELIRPLTEKGRSSNVQNINDEIIVERMMLPMILESIRCLEEKIVQTPMEVDLGILYGLGFPPFRGGVIQYAECVGLDRIYEWGRKYESLGALYRPGPKFEEMVKSGQKFYPEI